MSVDDLHNLYQYSARKQAVVSWDNRLLTRAAPYPQMKRRPT
jgi:hypothetical protein